MSLDLQKKNQVQKSGAEPKADVQKKSLATREAAKLGGYEVQMQKLTPGDDAAVKADMEKNTVDAQDPEAMAKLDEQAKNQPAPRGVDAKVMAEVEAEYKAATQPKLDQDRMMKLAARCLQLKREATPDQKKTLEGLIAAAVKNDPAASKNVVDIN